MYFYCDFFKLICFGLFLGVNGFDYGFYFKLYFCMYVFFFLLFNLVMVYEGEKYINKWKDVRLSR